MSRPPVEELLREAADTQHTVVLTWQEARDLLARLDVNNLTRYNN